MMNRVERVLLQPPPLVWRSDLGRLQRILYAPKTAIACGSAGLHNSTQ